MSIDLGSVGEWVGGIGTSIATLIAAIALKNQVDDHRRLHAEGIAGWTSIEEGVIQSIILSNASTMPVHDVIARVIYNRQTLAAISPDTLAPGTHSFPIDEIELWSGVADLNRTVLGPKVALIFRDSAGRVWRRKSKGVLVRHRRAYNWAEEYRRALAEAPPIRAYDENGNLVSELEPRIRPRD